MNEGFLSSLKLFDSAMIFFDQFIQSIEFSVIHQVTLIAPLGGSAIEV